jgi:4,5-DOPA dioxygenase extradiol
MTMTSPLPVLFVDHGSPMNALADNGYTRALKTLGRSLPRPAAVLCVSAHWYVDGVKVQSSARPKTIHDFGGFPDELHAVQYPAPGHPGLAAKARDLLAPAGAALTEDWGLDHGAWSPLVHLFPEADVPVFQVSLDRRLPAAEHLALGRRLAPLREEGVLILASGTIVHNLARLHGDPATPPFPWAVAFDAEVKRRLGRKDATGLLEGARPSLPVPTPDHYLPLLHAFGAAGESRPATVHEGFEHGSISLNAFLWK